MCLHVQEKTMRVCCSSHSFSVQGQGLFKSLGIAFKKPRL
jgi:hypothetical protein